MSSSSAAAEADEKPPTPSRAERKVRKRVEKVFDEKVAKDAAPFTLQEYLEHVRFAFDLPDLEPPSAWPSQRKERWTQDEHVVQLREHLVQHLLRERETRHHEREAARAAEQQREEEQRLKEAEEQQAQADLERLAHDPSGVAARLLHERLLEPAALESLAPEVRHTLVQLSDMAVVRIVHAVRLRLADRLPSLHYHDAWYDLALEDAAGAQREWDAVVALTGRLRPESAGAARAPVV